MSRLICYANCLSDLAMLLATYPFIFIAMNFKHHGKHVLKGIYKMGCHYSHALKKKGGGAVAQW